MLNLHLQIYDIYFNMSCAQPKKFSFFFEPGVASAPQASPGDRFVLKNLSILISSMVYYTIHVCNEYGYQEIACSICDMDRAMMRQKRDVEMQAMRQI